MGSKDVPVDFHISKVQGMIMNFGAWYELLFNHIKFLANLNAGFNTRSVLEKSR